MYAMACVTPPPYPTPLAKVFTVTQDLKVANVPLVVEPAVLATHSIVIPRPNLYAPVCPPGSFQNPDDYLPCIKCPPGKCCMCICFLHIHYFTLNSTPTAYRRSAQLYPGGLLPFTLKFATINATSMTCSALDPSRLLPGLERQNELPDLRQQLLQQHRRLLLLQQLPRQRHHI